MQLVNVKEMYNNDQRPNRFEVKHLLPRDTKARDTTTCTKATLNGISSDTITVLFNF